MSSTEYKDDHADKTLTPRQQAEQKLSKTSDAVGKALNSRLTGSIVKKMPLAIGIAVAAAYLHINTGGQCKTHQRIHGLWCRFENVNETFVNPHLEVLP